MTFPQLLPPSFSMMNMSTSADENPTSVYRIGGQPTKGDVSSLADAREQTHTATWRITSTTTPPVGHKRMTSPAILPEGHEHRNECTFFSLSSKRRCLEILDGPASPLSDTSPPEEFLDIESFVPKRRFSAFPSIPDEIDEEEEDNGEVENELVAINRYHLKRSRPFLAPKIDLPGSHPMCNKFL